MATAVSIRMAQANNDPFPGNYEAVLQDTWGHLAPKEFLYSGFILFTHGCHGDITLIDWEFKSPDGEELASSPWFYSDIHEMVGDLIIKKDLMRTGIWRWEGTFRRLKNGKSRWSGQHRPQRLSNRFAGARR